MSKSDENTNELDSYGVWVKNTPGNDQSQLDVQADNLDVESGDNGLDLPDFDDTNTGFSDMFRDEPQFSVDEQEDDFGNDLDSTLSTDELANITGLGDVAIENVDAEPIVDDFESSAPVFEEESVPDAEVEKENNFDDGTFESMVDSLDDPFSDAISAPTSDSDEAKIYDDFEEPGISESDDLGFSEDFSNNMETNEIDLENKETLENVTSEDSLTFEETESDSESSELGEPGNEEEISLDDFMDGGFSDESVASGNNGYEPGAEIAAEQASPTEEIALDDFLDADSFDDITSDSKAEAAVDDAPIDMDITFDDSVDTVETEENSSLDTDVVYDTEDDGPDFSDGFATDEEEPTTEISESEKVDFSSDNDSNIDTEEIDLSDFGIDSDAEETPIVQDVEDEKNNEKVVDYDLFVGNDNTSSAPIVNEIKDEKVEDVEEIIEEPKDTTTVDNSLLQQIVADLSSLKDEINNIKSNIAEMKSREMSAENNVDNEVANELDDTLDDIDVTEESTTDEIPIPDVVNDDELIDEDDIITEPVTGTDETIANSNDFQETLQEQDFNESIDETVSDDTVAGSSDNFIQNSDDTISNEADIDFEDNDILGAETSVEIPEDNNEGGFFSADDTDETIALSGDELSNIMNNADFGENMEFEDGTSKEDSDSSIDNDFVAANNGEEPENDSEEDATTEDNVTYNEDTLDKFNLDDKDSDFTLEETPFEENLDDVSIDESIVEDNFYDNIPEEIAIPKDDDIFVASTSSDFMDSVKDTTEEMDLDTEPLNDVEEITEIEEVENNDNDDQISDTPSVESFDTIEDVDDSDNIEIETSSDEFQDIPTVDKVLEEEVSNDVEFTEPEVADSEDTAEESFSDVDFLNNGALEDFDDEIEDNNSDETIAEESGDNDGDDEVSFDDVDFLNTTEEVKVAAEEESAETDEPEITFDDVDFLNADEPGIISDINFDTVSDDDSEETTELGNTFDTNGLQTEADSISDDTFVEDNVIEEAEPSIEETAVEPSEVNTDDSFTEVDNLDNNLSTSNIDYLTKEDGNNVTKENSVNNDLRQEIKSVLLYMDQLLESLPEDKIYEFAKSEEFATYKKLFKDLGLS